MYCSRCGNKNPEDVKFCSKCGNIMSVNSAVSSKENDSELKKKVSYRVIKVVLVTLMLFVQVVAFAIVFDERQPIFEPKLTCLFGNQKSYSLSSALEKINSDGENSSLGQFYTEKNINPADLSPYNKFTILYDILHSETYLLCDSKFTDHIEVYTNTLDRNYIDYKTIDEITTPENPSSTLTTKDLFAFGIFSWDKDVKGFENKKYDKMKKEIITQLYSISNFGKINTKVFPFIGYLLLAIIIPYLVYQLLMGVLSYIMTGKFILKILPSKAWLNKIRVNILRK